MVRGRARRIVISTYVTVLFSGLFTFGALHGFISYYNRSYYSSKSFAAHQAFSFLHGRLDLRSLDRNTHDVSIYKNKVYAYWPPLSAILVTPVVYFTGPFDFPQVHISIFLAALNTMIAGLIAANIISVYMRCRSFWILVSALAFGLGTSNVIFGGSNNPWFFMQLPASTFMLLSVLFGYRYWKYRRQLGLDVAGVMLAIACLGRSHLGFSILFLAGLHYATLNERSIRKYLLKLQSNLLPAMVPIVFSFIFLGVYNFARFDSPFEFGMRYQNKTAETTAAYKKSERRRYIVPTQIVENIYIQLVRPYPSIAHDRYTIDEGFGVFFQAPFLIMSLLFFFYGALHSFCISLWFGVLPSLLMIVGFIGSGRIQFGARYIHDLVPFLFAISLSSWCSAPGVAVYRKWLFLIFTLLSIGINFYGLSILR